MITIFAMLASGSAQAQAPLKKYLERFHCAIPVSKPVDRFPRVGDTLCETLAKLGAPVSFSSIETQTGQEITLTFRRKSVTYVVAFGANPAYSNVNDLGKSLVAISVGSTN